MTRLRVGLVGAGTMGALHARGISSGQRTDLAWISDPSELTGRSVAERYGVTYMPEPDFASVDAVVIAAPTQIHRTLGLEALRHGRPLLMEKPLANTLDEVDELLSESEALDVPIVCGLLERFNPAVRTAFELSRSPLHFRSVRHSPMTARITTGVAGDLLIHDLDLALRLFSAAPTEVVGMTDRNGEQVEDIAEALVKFESGALASLSASRRSQRKIRSMLIAEPDRLIEVDLLRQDVTIYRHVLESPTDDDLGYRQQTIIDIPVLRHHGEPLMLQLEHFVDVVEGTSDHNEERVGIRLPHAVLESITTVLSP